MSPPDLTQALIDLSRSVGANTEATRSIEQTVNHLATSTDKRMTAIEARVDVLEAERDRRKGAEQAAADALGKVDRRVKLVGLVLGAISLVDHIPGLGGK